MPRPKPMRRRAPSPHAANRARPQLRAAVEAMEMRLVLSTFVVNTFVDQIDPPGSATISLRDAIALAAKHAGNDTIDVPAGDYPLLKGELLIGDRSGAVAINAIGGVATIDAKHNSRVLHIVADSTVSGSGLTITGGYEGYGGGILNRGDLTLANSSVTGNTASSSINSEYPGGGIYNKGELTLVGDMISYNSGGSGGGIENDGTLIVADSTLSHNSAGLYNNLTTNGGAIDNSGSATLDGVTVSDNESGVNGGGIENTGTLHLADSTISGNFSASGRSGGIYNSGTTTLTSDLISYNAYGEIDNEGKLILADCTLTGSQQLPTVGGYALYNHGAAIVADDTIDGNPGGIATHGSLTIANTIVANNNFEDSREIQFDNVSGAFTSLGGNFIDSNDGGSGWIASDQTGTSLAPIDPKLTPFGNYGGPTQTFVPLAGSPVLGRGVVGAIPAGVTTDQRGLLRVVKGKVDIGAVEVQAAPLIHILSPPPQTFVAGRTVNVSLGLFSAPAGSGPFVIDVNWGDGTPDAVFSQDHPGAIPMHTHFFPAADHFTGSVAVTNAAGDKSNLAALPVTVVIEPPAIVVVNTTKDQIDAPGGKTVSLRDAVALDGGPVTITFDPNVFATHQTIRITDQLELADNFGPVTIIGPAAGVTISENVPPEFADGKRSNVLLIDTGVVATLSRLTIEAGGYNPNSYATDGIDNRGNLTITNSVISNCDTGISNTGELIIQDSTISGNASIRNGAGLYNTGTAIIFGATFSGNVTYDPFDVNYLSNGGAIYNSGTLTVTNSTLSGNTAATTGGGLCNMGEAVVDNCTIAANSAYGGCGIYNADSGELTIGNSIVATNILLYGDSREGPDAAGTIKSRGHNLIGQTDGSTGWVGSDLKGTAAHPLSPELSPLADYGGPTPTQFPVAGSPAIGAGSVALIPSGTSTDQRGFARTVGGKVDIGAVELQKAHAITVTPPAARHVIAGVPTSIDLGSFADPGGKGPFTVDVDWGDGSPVSVYVTNSAGKLGSHTHAYINTGSLTTRIAVCDASGAVSQFAAVSISAALAPPATLVVNTVSDQVDPASSKTVSLRDAIGRADASFGPVTITFDPVVFALPRTITLSENYNGTLTLVDNRFGKITLVAPNAGVSIDGGILVGATISASFDRLTIHGKGIINNGTLAVSDCIISGAQAIYGAVENFGALSLVDSIITGNTGVFGVDRGGPYGGYGGGIGNFDGASMTILDCTISGNNALGGHGGGILNYGKLAISESTVANNQDDGVYNSGTLTLTDSTISGNTSGGIVNRSYGSTRYGNMTIADCTIAANTSQYGVGGIDNSSGGSVTLSNTIIAENSGDTPDVSGKFKSLGHNLIGKTNGGTGWLASDPTGSDSHPLDAKLSPLGDHGGPTKTMIPLAGSPALQAGSVALIPPGVTVDQRGLPRVVNGKVDIGAIESN